MWPFTFLLVATENTCVICFFPHPQTIPAPINEKQQRPPPLPPPSPSLHTHTLVNIRWWREANCVKCNAWCAVSDVLLAVCSVCCVQYLIMMCSEWFTVPDVQSVICSVCMMSVILSSQVVSLPLQSVTLEVANFCAKMDTLIGQDERGVKCNVWSTA